LTNASLLQETIPEVDDLSLLESNQIAGLPERAPARQLRRYMRDKATKLRMANLYVLNGFLHAIPLPARNAEEFLTCQAIGWNPTEELAEIERVLEHRNAPVRVRSCRPTRNPAAPTAAGARLSTRHL
jgi:hypothetical protein